jgi:hypothetical protein
VDESASAAELRQRMQEIRRKLGPEVDAVVDNALQLTNWKYYVRSFPWGSLGAVAALGYFAIPRKLETIRPDPETIKQLARENRLVIEHKPKAEQKPGLMESLFNLAGNVVLRAGLVYLGQQAGRFLGEHASQPAGEEVATP